MYRLLILVVFFSICSRLSAQNTNPEKSELKKILRKSIDQESRKMISTISNPWIINNTDSFYFKADTINIKKHYNYNNRKN